MEQDGNETGTTSKLSEEIPPLQTDVVKSESQVKEEVSSLSSSTNAKRKLVIVKKSSLGLIPNLQKVKINSNILSIKPEKFITLKKVQIDKGILNTVKLVKKDSFLKKKTIGTGGKIEISLINKTDGFNCKICSSRYNTLPALLRHGITHKGNVSDFMKTVITQFLNEVFENNKKSQVENIKLKQELEILKRKNVDNENLKLKQEIDLLRKQNIDYENLVKGLLLKIKSLEEKLIEDTAKKMLVLKVNPISPTNKAINSGSNKIIKIIKQKETTAETGLIKQQCCALQNENKILLKKLELLKYQVEDLTKKQNFLKVYNPQEGSNSKAIGGPDQLGSKDVDLSDTKNIKQEIGTSVVKSEKFFESNILPPDLSHEGKNTFLCKCCKQTFPSRKSLVEHSKKHHRNVRTHVCPYCTEIFSSMKKMENHKKTHKKDFVCLDCGRAFYTNEKLQVHQQSHMPGKHHVCEECNRGFCSKASLLQHKFQHTGEKPYKCLECNTAYIRHSQLQMHNVNVHHQSAKPYNCDNCGKGFCMKSHLRNHMYTHTMEKPFTCHICRKKFSQNFNLKEHIARHTGERKHLCCYCGRGFIRNSELLKHIKKVHEDMEAKDIETS